VLYLLQATTAGATTHTSSPQPLRFLRGLLGCACLKSHTNSFFGALIAAGHNSRSYKAHKLAAATAFSAGAAVLRLPSISHVLPSRQSALPATHTHSRNRSHLPKGNTTHASAHTLLDRAGAAAATHTLNRHALSAATTHTLDRHVPLTTTATQGHSRHARSIELQQIGQGPKQPSLRRQPQQGEQQQQQPKQQRQPQQEEQQQQQPKQQRQPQQGEQQQQQQQPKQQRQPQQGEQQQQQQPKQQRQQQSSMQGLGATLLNGPVGSGNLGCGVAVLMSVPLRGRWVGGRLRVCLCVCVCV